MATSVEEQVAILTQMVYDMETEVNNFSDATDEKISSLRTELQNYADNADRTMMYNYTKSASDAVYGAVAHIDGSEMCDGGEIREAFYYRDIYPLIPRASYNDTMLLCINPWGNWVPGGVYNRPTPTNPTFIGLSAVGVQLLSPRLHTTRTTTTTPTRSRKFPSRKCSLTAAPLTSIFNGRLGVIA